AHGLLRQRWADLGKRPRELLGDRDKLVRSVVGARGGDAEMLVSELNWATTRGLGGVAYAELVGRGERRSPTDTRAVAAAIDAYAAAKRERGQIDVDDLLTLTIRELERDNAYREATRWR